MKKPMKADTLKSVDQIPSEWWGNLCQSMKLDGIRSFVEDGVVLSNSRKPIPNRWVQETFGRPEYEGLDGELIVGPPNAEDVYRRTMSAVMSRDGVADADFHLFDVMDPSKIFKERLEIIQRRSEGLERAPVILHKFPSCKQEFLDFHNEILDDGMEGSMLRLLSSSYKYGRSTLRQGWLLKFKPFDYYEGVIVGYRAQLHNANEATINEMGHTARSGHKANLIEMDTLGSLDILVPEFDHTCRVGGGFKAAQRKELWEEKESLIGKIIRVKHFPIGVKDRPRQPIFEGFRVRDDLSSDHPIFSKEFQERLTSVMQ